MVTVADWSVSPVASVYVSVGVPATQVATRLSHNPVALHPGRVARVIYRAAIARHPRPFYRVGGLAHVILGP